MNAQLSRISRVLIYLYHILWVMASFIHNEDLIVKNDKEIPDSFEKL